MSTPKPVGPVSQELTNPSAWDSLFQTLGFEGGLVIFLIAVGLAVTAGAGFLAYKVARWLFGEDGWLQKATMKLVERVCTFMDASELRLDSVVAKLQKHGEDCDARHANLGPSNVKSLENAGHAAAEALKKIGRGEHCDEEAGLIHLALGGGIRDQGTIQHKSPQGAGEVQIAAASNG